MGTWVPGTRLTVFAIKRTEMGGSIWVRAGMGLVNRDLSLNLYLDVLPIGGQLHVRESVYRRDATPPPLDSPAGANPLNAVDAPMGPLDSITGPVPLNGDDRTGSFPMDETMAAGGQP